MANQLTVVLDDQKTLRDLCGANDINIKEIERLVEAPIYTRGNTIMLESTDQRKRSVFEHVIQALQDYAEVGNSASPELIRAIFSSFESGTPDEDIDLQELSISIPRGNTTVAPRSDNQARYMRNMQNKELVFGIGPAGTGKTFLAVAYALHELLTKKYRKLILTRPVVEAGESLGFLPGDLAQKIDPYLKPLFDAMEALLDAEIIRKLEEHRRIEVAPLAYMRGRSLRDSFIILDEAQNTSKEQMKMFLTRIGENTRAIITGDITQIDLQKKKESGLIHVISVLQDVEDISFVFFEARDVVRNPLVKKIIKAYENETQ